MSVFDGLTDFGLGSKPLVFTQEEADGPYTQYTVTIRYRWVGNVVQQAVAGTSDDQDQTCRVYQTARPTCQKVVAWSASRLGAKPSLPSPVSSDSDLTLALAEFVVPPPQTTATGDGYIYTVSGVYTYYCSTPWVPGSSSMNGPAIPATTATVYDTGITPDQFKPNIF